MTNASGKASLQCHVVKTGGRQCRVLLQCFQHKGHIRIDDGRTYRALNFGQARLRQHPVNSGVVNTQLRGDGVHAPVLNKMVAEYFCFTFLINSHVDSPCFYVDGVSVGGESDS